MKPQMPVPQNGVAAAATKLAENIPSWPLQQVDQSCRNCKQVGREWTELVEPLEHEERFTC